MERPPPHSADAIRAKRVGGKKVPKQYRKYHQNGGKNKDQDDRQNKDSSLTGLADLLACLTSKRVDGLGGQERKDDIGSVQEDWVQTEGLIVA
ncbi:hypothetical protein SNOG_11608 [Parastagonospora nodorum SN15]|uniref:Uncharacterized protein n=1 Tax=Phaeosphaeria nodorum (strain SN15 / ATCC MYA-4574 / FGSC 10173) TaxID=321614 RepID=Q0U9F6_PHANO|nr:hypothetical protein SNOG_11608 [Parastagonospora nodorum SN15]EAT81316.1 hypothetical protein SNOG_11608 [Parastagonospora nodorum SN15]